MKIRDRVKELRQVKVSELVPNPKNWRMYPKAQADALRGLEAVAHNFESVTAEEQGGLDESKR